jgi:hypothetical protein
LADYEVEVPPLEADRKLSAGGFFCPKIASSTLIEASRPDSLGDRDRDRRPDHQRDRSRSWVTGEVYEPLGYGQKKMAA